MNSISTFLYEQVNNSYSTIIQSAKWAGRKIHDSYNFILPHNAVTGNREFRLIPVSVEKFLGNNLYPIYLESAGSRTISSKLQEEITDIGNKLSKETARKGLDYEFTVLDSNITNAWALPNGKIAIYEGLINKIHKFYLEMQNKSSDYKDVNIEDVKAAVLAHEIIHSDARHTARNMEITLLAQLMIFVCKKITSFFIQNKLKQNRNSIQSIANNIFQFLNDKALNLYLHAYSRTHEHQADTYGMALMHKAGYNPKGALVLQEMFMMMEGGKPSKLHRYTFGWLRSHPYASDRLETNKAMLKTLEVLDQTQKNQNPL